MKHIYLLLFLILVAGCGPAAAKRVPVEGTVTFQGEPVTDAAVIIRPEFGPAAGSMTDANGKFSIPKAEGPIAGNVKIMVEKVTKIQTKGSDGRVNSTFKPALPEDVQGKLMPFVIKDGKNTLDIKLDK